PRELTTRPRAHVMLFALAKRIASTWSKAKETVMTISVFSAARYLCEKSGWTLSNLQLQKLVYLAHMVHLGSVDREKGLIRERFEAWDYGPVSPALYSEARAFGSGSVKNIFHGHKVPEEAEVLATLDAIYDD